jgi:soluble lytic murein transglycosylase
MKDKILALIILIGISVISTCYLDSKLSEEKDYSLYSSALNSYQKEDYSTAYRCFKKITLFSEIKAPALFRQARCATEIGDVSGAKRNYRILLWLYPNSPLYVVSEYNLAMLMYDMGDFSARKHFVHIIKYYPETDFALASEYYVASIDMKKAQDTKLYWLRKDMKRKSLNHFIRYVKLSPDGRFTQESINKIQKSGIVITEDDNLALAESYFQRGLYSDASSFFKDSPLELCWAKYAKNEFKKGNYPLAKSLTENGLKCFSNTVDRHDAYEAIDSYIDISDNKLTTINYLLNKYPKSKQADYLLYLKARYSSESNQFAIYEKLYDKYPDSDFSAEALYKVFYLNIDKGNYQKALQLGQKHLAHFKHSDTAPAVLFWIGKIYERKNNIPMSRSYYKSVISRYPDSYYSYRAYTKLHKDKELFINSNAKEKPIEFPRTNKKEQNMATKLIEIGDYDFVSELYKEDGFVQSWIAYKQNKPVQSVILAQKAMKDLYPKPDFEDVRWRLVYPLNFYDYAEKYKGEQDPFMIMSIIREESHFNTEIQSPVGALGLMQLMPATAQEIASSYGLNCNLLNPENNIQLGSLYYTKMKKSLWDKDAYAIMAYNGGWFSVVNWTKTLKYKDMDDFVEKIPYPETQMYVKKVLRSYWNYSNIY